MAVYSGGGVWFGDASDPDDTGKWQPLGIALCERDCGRPATVLLIAGEQQFWLCPECARRQTVLRQIRHAGTHGLN